jgi:UDP-2,3-diacylglucosamine pyrophosphatase LpxH
MAGTRYVILGDTHGDFFWTLKVLDHAKDLKISTIFQVGDWGFLWPDENGKTGDQVAALAEALRSRGQRMFFIDGNHDWHPKLRRRKKWPAEIAYCPRGHIHVFVNDDGQNVRVGFLGGAPSIDKQFRVEGEDWWPEEEIQDDELPVGKCDVLITHDAPERPHNLAELELPMSLVYRCRMSMAKIQQAVRQTQPRLLYHGHYHWPYKGSFEGTEVRGLNCNRKQGAYIVVNHNFEEVTDRITGWVHK